MRRPVALFIGLRYLRSSKGSGFISFVNAASIIGVTLGVATLIVVLSVMNGFENELRERLLGLTSHASIIGPELETQWPEIVGPLKDQPGIRGAAPFVELEAMLSGPGGMAPGLLTGIAPALEVGVSQVGASLILGNLDELHPGSRRIILGRALASKLGVSVGSTLSILIPQLPRDGRGLSSQIASFTVSGIFELGVQDHDSVRAILHLEDALEISSAGSRTTGIRVETENIFSAPEVVRAAMDALLLEEFIVRDWTQENASYFRAIRLEKTMMSLLLSLIIGVAAFNIVAMLVMVVTEKRGGIAILRTLGCSRREIVAIFVLQGTIIGWLGAGLGILIGVWMALNVDSLAPALEAVFGFQFMPADLYYLTALPSDLRSADVLWTSVAVLAITAAATIYPALRAAMVQPAEVLRYE